MHKFPDRASNGLLLRQIESKDDIRFVVKSWIRDYVHPRNPFSGSCERERLIKAVKGTIHELLTQDDVFCVMACPNDDRDQIYGFICFERGPDYPVLHYVYVKAPFRGHDIGTSLVNLVTSQCEGVLRYTFKTPCCSKFLTGAKYNWNLVRKRKKEKNVSKDSTEA